MKLLLGVDVQNCFMSEGGTLVLPGDLTKIRKNIEKIINCDKKINKIMTMDAHKEGDEEISDNPDFINTFPKHAMLKPLITDKGKCIDYIIPWDVKLIEEATCSSDHATLLTPETTQVQTCFPIIVMKNKFDVFQGSKAMPYIIADLPNDKITIFGVALDVCVKFAVEGFLERGWEVTLIEDACASLDEEEGKRLITKWKKEGVKIISTQDYLK